MNKKEMIKLLEEAIEESQFQQSDDGDLNMWEVEDAMAKVIEELKKELPEDDYATRAKKVADLMNWELEQLGGGTLGFTWEDDADLIVFGWANGKIGYDIVRDDEIVDCDIIAIENPTAEQEALFILTSVIAMTV